MSKTVPLSVRITEADASFIAELKVADAVTPSEKLRVLLAEARQRHRSGGDMSEAVAYLRALLAPQRERVREGETTVQLHSELVGRTWEWLPEIFAYCLTAPLSNSDDPRDSLVALEQGLATRLVSLMESVLRLAVTRKNPCYDPEAISSRLGQVVELVELIGRGKREDAQ